MGNISFDYYFMSDPPSFADIGSASIIFENTTIQIDGVNSFDDEEL